MSAQFQETILMTRKAFEFDVISPKKEEWDSVIIYFKCDNI